MLKENMLKKVNKTIILLRKLQYNLPGVPLVIIYKSFIKVRLDYTLQIPSLRKYQPLKERI